MSPEQRHTGASGTVPSAILQGDAPSLDAKRLTYGFAVASFLAVAMGCMVARAAGVGFGVWARNPAAWVIGALLAGLIARIRPAPFVRAVLLIAPLAFLASLFNPGTAGVHRWISLGPLHWNVSFLLLSAVTVAFAATTESGPRWTIWAVMLVQSQLVLQPDASQATAFGAASVVTLLTTRSTRRDRIAASLFFLLASVLAWTRPGPLAPVPEVEGIIGLARSVSGAMAALCVVSLAAVTISPLLARKLVLARGYPPALALFVYFLGCMLMPLAGAFPVPLVGMGMSPILGFCFGIGGLITVCKPTKPTDYKQSRS
jgi:cell division protein FtsW (lipid II flippase)